MKNTSYPVIIIGLAVIIILGMGWLWVVGGKAQAVDATNLAQCLASKNITMYGADWCAHCQNEKRAFGDAFQYVPYVECPQDPQRCLDAGVTGYPTWIMPDGKKLVGEQGLKKLSEASGCQLTP